MPAAALPSDLAASHDLLQALLAVSLPGIILFRPVYADDEPATVIDLAYVHLNPAAQQMLRLPVQPPETFLTLYPNTRETGIFAFYRDTFLSGQPGEYAVNYPYDGLDNFFQLTARRSGELLVVGFTDTAAQDRSQVEQALRESQAREQAARAEAEAQRQRFYDVLMQLPAQVATYHGPEHVYQFVNARYGKFVSQHELLGRPVREAGLGAVPDQVFEMLDRVYATGEPVQLRELEVVLNRYQPGRVAPLFIDAFYLPLRDGQGGVYGVLDFSYDVTELVLARRQVEQLNQELEGRVQERTAAVQAALRRADQQQNQLRQILGQVPAAIATLEGPEHRYRFFNDAYQTLSGGRTRLDAAVAEVFPEVVPQGFIGLLDEVYATGRPVLGTETPAQLFSPATGRPELRYVDFIYQPLADNGQARPSGILAFVVDVTERVQARRQTEALQAELLAVAQRQVREREAFQQVFEQTPALVALLRAPGHRFEYVNPAYQALFPGQQLVGLDMAVAVPAVQEQGFVALLDRVYETGETYFGADLPFTPAPAAGELAQTAYFNFTYQAYRENGEIAGISIFAFDVTEQVRARQQREMQQAQLRELFEQAPVAVAIFEGPDYVIEVANPLVAAIWGRTPAQVLGRPLFDALPEVRDQGFRELLDRVVATGEAFVAQEVSVLLQRNGELETVYLNFVYQPLRDAHGRVAAVAAVATEVSAQVAAREQVQRLNEQLTATNAELATSNTQLTRTNVDLDTFVYTASHDLKAPITNIEGILLALREQLPAAVQQEETVATLLEMLQGTVARFQLTITQLTDITKLQLAHAGPAEPVVLARVVEDVRLDLVPLLTEAGAALTVDVPPLLEVSFSPANLRSVVYNLLSNAIKYRSPDRPVQVQVRAEHTPPAVVLTVQDNGLGMSEVQLRQLFGLFQRLHTHVEGTGVGLYIVKRLVENGGGTIAVQSQPDAGTTFTVTFPHPGA